MARLRFLPPLLRSNLHPYPRMEMRIHVPGRLVADVRRCLQVRKPRHLHAARRTEVVEQRALAGGTDAGDFVQFALPDVLRPPRPVRRDGKPVRLVAQALQASCIMKLFIPWGNILQAFFIKLTDTEVVGTDPERCVRRLKLRYVLRVDGDVRIAMVPDPLVRPQRQAAGFSQRGQVPSDLTIYVMDLFDG